MQTTDRCSADRYHWISLVTLATVFAACGPDVASVAPPPPPPPARVVEIDLFGPDSALSIGTTFQLRVVALDSNGHVTTTPAVTWTTSKPEVATVSATGLLTGIAVGFTTITAQAGTLVRTATVNVAAGPAISLTIGGPQGGLGVGVNFSFVAQARDQFGNLVAAQLVSWSSGDPTVATISATGLVTTLKAGVTVIQASVGTVTGSFSLVVSGLPGLSSLQLSGVSGAMPVGMTATVTATARDTQGRILVNPLATWSVGDPQVATINTVGAAQFVAITAVGIGTTIIQAQFGGLTAQISVTVRSIEALDVNVALLPDAEFGDTIQLAPGQTLQLTGYAYNLTPYAYVLLPTAGATTWSSSRADLATVSSTGLVTAVASGTAHVTSVMYVGSASSPTAVTGSRNIRVASTPGTATVRLLNASDAVSTITMASNAGPPSALAVGQVNTASVPAGTFQLSAAEFPPSAVWACGMGAGCFNAGQFEQAAFTGFLPAGSQATFVATVTQYGFSVMPLWDFGGPVAADSVRVRVGLVTSGGYNIYIVPTGMPIGVIFLQGCYLDWPFGFTDYAARGAGTFDIVLQPGKGVTGPESARFTVTPSPGHATTYILAGNSSATLKVIPLVDH